MLSIGYKEIDILREIMNFKIVDKNRITDNYDLSKTELSDIVKKLNNLLEWSKLNPLISKRGYILFNNERNEHKLRMDGIVKFKNSIRREMIYLFLLLSEKHFNITKFTLKLKLSEYDRKYVRRDIKTVLETLNIDYSEYREFKNPLEIIKRKIENFEMTRKNYIKNLLIKRFERGYLHKTKNYEENNIDVEELLFEIMEEELKIKDIKYIFRNFQNFYESYGKLFSVDEKYDFFTYFVLSLYNEKENVRKRITSKSVKMKEDKDYILLSEMLDKISKNENIRIYSYFRLKLYKLLLKKEKENFNMKNIKSREILYNSDISNEKATGEYVYQIAEETGNTEVPENIEKRKTILAIDMEYSEMVKSRKNIKTLFEIADIVETVNLENLNKKLNNSDNDDIEQVFLLSTGEVQNLIDNYSNIPIYFFRIGKENRFGRKIGKLKRRSDFKKQLDEINKMIMEYDKYK